MKRPLVLVIISCLLGIYSTYNLILKDSSFIVSLFLFFIIIILLLRERSKYLWLLLFTFIISVTLTINKTQNSQLIFLKNEFIEAEGIIKEKGSKSTFYSRYVLDIIKVRHDNNYYSLKEKVLVQVKGDVDLELGNKIKIRGIVSEPKTNTNPKLFNYKLYLQSKGIYTIITVDRFSMELIEVDQISILQKYSLLIKENIIKALDSNLNTKNSYIMKSIILGDDTYLNEQTLDKFRDLGIAHILAVSGLHVGILAVFIKLLLDLIRINRKASTVLTIVLLWFYGYIIGYPTSVLRALIMFTAMMLTNFTLRRYDKVNCIIFAAILLLLYNPLWLFDVGFQLSFTATTSLIVYTKRIDCIFASNLKLLGKYISPIMAVQIGIFPVTAYHFNNFSLVGFLANLVLIPLLSLIVIAAFILVFIYSISVKFSILLGIILNVFIDISMIIVDILDKFPFTTVNLTSPSLGGILLFYILVLLVLRIIKINLKDFNVSKAILVYLYTLILFISFISYFESQANIQFIDVGQGDAALIRTKNKKLLIDCGGSSLGDYDIGERILAPYLLKNGIRKIDAVFLSHFHNDHSEGLLSLMDEVEVKKIFAGYEIPENELYTKIYSKAKEMDIPIVIINRGDKVIVSKDIEIEVLWPDSEVVSLYRENENNLSMVLILSIFGKKVLFTGDIEKDVEDVIANEKGICDVDIVKVPHHGSNTSSTLKFINNFTPNYGVISVGNNNFGHPNINVLKRYNENNTLIYRTDSNGLVSFIIKPNKLFASPYIKDSYMEGNLKKENILKFFYLSFFLIGSLLLIVLYKSKICSKINIELINNNIIRLKNHFLLSNK